MSGLEAVGAAASVVQLAAMGFRLVVALSNICQRLKDHPEKLKKRQRSVEQLVEITKAIESTPDLDRELVQSVMKTSVIDAQALLDLIEPIAFAAGDGRGKRYWKALCGAAKEDRILGLLDGLEERKTALILCIGVANSSVLRTVDKSIMDLATKAQDAFSKMPNIEQSVEQIATRLQALVVDGRLDESARTAPTAARLQAVELALPSLDNRLEEASILQRAIFQLATSIKRSLEPQAVFDESIDLPTPPDSSRQSLHTRRTSTLRSPDDEILHPVQTNEKQFLVPVSQNTLFTGRSHIIEQIHTHFSPEFFPRFGEQRRLVLTGLGGVGKTQIATAYTYEAYTTKDYSFVLWIFASNREEIIKSLIEAAKSLGLDAGPPLANELETPELMPPSVMNLMRWLSRDSAPRWLLVFDNVDDLDSFDISTFFPKVPWGDILITSRRQQAARFGQQIVVDVMQPDEAIELLQKCSGLLATENDSAVQELVEALGHLPLALDQAGAYIAEQSIDFGIYVEIYKDSRAHLLRHKPPKAVWSYEETVFTTWEISFSAISKSDPLAASLLDVAAFFNSDDIPLGLLCNLAQRLGPDRRPLLPDFVDCVRNRSDYAQMAGPLHDDFGVPKLKTQLAVGKLASFSLIQHKPQSQSLSVHPLVHFWLRETQRESDRVRHARNAVCLTFHALVNAYDLSHFSSAEVIYPHMFVCLEHIHAMPGLLTATELHKIGACIIALDSWVPISFEAGTLNKADRFYDHVNACQADAEWVIPEAMLMMRQALRLKSQGLRAKTSELCDQYFEIFAPRTRFDKMYAASMARTSGPCFFRSGDYDGAERVYGRIDDSLDPTGVMLARKKLVLGAIKIDRGLPRDAERILSSCVSGLRKSIGHEHFLLSVWHQLMSLSYIAQGKYREAEETLKPRLMGRLEKLAARQIRFNFSDFELVEVFARILREQKRFAEAQGFLQDVLAKTASKLPPPARALGELSLMLTRLERAISDLEDAASREEQESRAAEVDDLVPQVLKTFENAAYAYEVEWNRGTWVFKHFASMMEKHQLRVKQLGSKLDLK